MALLIQSCLEWQRVGLAPPERVTRATRQLFEELDPIGRFAVERLTEDPEGFLTTDEISAAYSVFLHDNDVEDSTDHRTLMGRLKDLPGVTRVTRVGADRVRHRGLLGRKLIDPDTRHT
jgi:phage/plasmid-associated DNA primase